MLGLRKTYDWMGKQVHTTYAVPLLALLFFIEAIFFIPVDPLLILFCLENRAKSLYYATIATCASVAGGLAGYYIGYAVWEVIGQKLVFLLFNQEQFNEILSKFKEYEIWTVLIAGFTPIPYKLVTLGAGFCKLPILPFVICSFIARGARFYLIAGTIAIWGEQVKRYIDRYFDLLVILFTIVVIGAVWFMI